MLFQIPQKLNFHLTQIIIGSGYGLPPNRHHAMYYLNQWCPGSSMDICADIMALYATFFRAYVYFIHFDMVSEFICFC